MSAAATPDDVTRAIEQPVALTDYDPAWAAQFEAERRRLDDALPGAFVAIEHIGSTAVAGMRSKPLIDLLAGVRSMDEAIAINQVIDRIGYTTSPALNATLKTRQWFMRQSNGRRTHHLHVVVHGSDDWTARIHFRDSLRTDPALRARYAALKEDLAVRFAANRDAYTEGKSTFIGAVNETRTSAMTDRSDAAYRLHCFAQSGNAYKVALLLELGGADWSPTWVDFFNGATRTPDFKAKNEMAEVPVLEHAGHTLTQSGVILDYLAETLGRFGANDADERREILRWMLWDNHKLTSPIATLRFMINFMPKDKQDPAVLAWLRTRMTGALKTLEAHLADRRYVVADRLTIADFSLIGYLYFPAEFGVDWTAYPAIDAWTARIAAEPGWKHPYDLMPGHPLPT